jgi:Cysteine-rich CPCC
MNIECSGGDTRMFAFLERRRSNLLLSRYRQSNVLSSENRFRCPCCGYKTLKAPGALGLCPVCWWEDDGQDDEDAEEVRLTVNGNLSLCDARHHYSDCGASDPRFLTYVRKPELAER